ncbi:hypothetical protein ACOTVD_00005, partial [Campylobacter jejuni]|uniref:hypothetical protein n=1 Tax=Campylobacter jejuni TaxID=197 RepID=UPI003B9D89FE
KDKTGRYIEDKNKTRRLLEKLNIIGQNNLKAMYMGINGNEESLKAIGKRENNTSKTSANADMPYSIILKGLRNSFYSFKLSLCF